MFEIISSMQRTVVLLLLHEFKFSSVGNSFQNKFQQLFPFSCCTTSWTSEFWGPWHYPCLRYCSCTRNNVNPVLVKANSHWSHQDASYLIQWNYYWLPCNSKLLEGFSVFPLKCTRVSWKSSSFLDLLGWVMGNWLKFCVSCGWVAGFVHLKNNLPKDISVQSLNLM